MPIVDLEPSIIAIAAELVPIPLQGSLSVAAPSSVFTIARVAKMLGEDEAFLEEVASEMEPEDGCLWICDVDDEHDVIGFTPFGIECLKELSEIHEDQRTPRPRE